MPATELRYGNRAVYFRKAITAPRLQSQSVLARDAFQFVELWLRREKQEDAAFFWAQARSLFIASKQLPATSAPLTSYYCFLNAVKALLTVKKVTYSEHHGVSGETIESKRTLSNEIIEIKNSGIVAEMSHYLNEDTNKTEYSLNDVLANLPFIHRAYCLTYRTQAELFIPLRNPIYVRHPVEDKIWFAGEVIGRHADRRVMRTLPAGFEIDEGGSCDGKIAIRRKNRVRWFPKKGANQENKEMALKRFYNYHRKLRTNVVFISAPTDIWYIKRNPANSNVIDRFGLTLIMAAMHKLSELARYDPKGLSKHLNGPANWLLTEFIELAPTQFIDEIACEITGLEFRVPGVRV